jgi:hypothetical protein
LISARKILSVQVEQQYVMLLVVVLPMKVELYQNWMMQVVVVYQMKKVVVVHQP